MPHTTWIEDGLPAYEGETYIGFDHHPNSPLINSIDSISQKLTCPLVANRRNSFSIAIYTMAEKNIIGSFGHGVLRLYGSNVSCATQQLLWESPVTTNQWQLFLANFTPDSSWRYITLKPWSIDGGDDLIGIDAMSDISVEDYTFLDLDTLQMPADSNCYALKANSDMGGVNYSWHSEPALQFNADSLQEICIMEDTWVYVDLLGSCDVYRDSVLLKYKGVATGIGDKQGFLHVAIYPNPATNTFTVQWDSNTIKAIQLVTVIGQVIEERSGGGTEVFDVQHLAKGIYFIKFLNSDRGILHTEKVMLH